MDFWTPVKDIVTCLWSCSATNITYIKDLEKNLQNLRDSIEDLKGLNQDVGIEIEREVEAGRQLKNRNEVELWRLKAQKKVKTVEEILKKVDQKRQGCCPNNCLCIYCLGVTVTEEIAEVERVIEDKRKFVRDFVLAQNALVEKLYVTETVGLDPTFDRIWGYVEDESVGMIAIYGMGGVGKTTILNKINNKFTDNNYSFQVVIRVVLSENQSLKNVQEAICSKLAVADELWEKKKTEDARSAHLRGILEKRKFLLLLDDLRSKLDLSKAGLPLLDDTVPGSKVVFTARSEDLFGTVKDVCGRTRKMENVKVECLETHDALQVLQMNLHNDILADEEMSKHVKDVAVECKGLPLALITIGRAMARKRGSEEWQHAITQLQSYPSQFPGMKEVVFPKLRFSYDNLNDREKKCFLYCSYFPENQEIPKRELINLWIGEGFIKTSNHIKARNDGFDIIGNLERACLLEGCESKDHVKMHDVIRDMALWIICSEGKEEEKILVQQDAEWNRGRELTTWRKAVVISLWGSHLHDLPAKTEFPLCRTMIVRETKLKKLPTRLFTDALQVLDLSNNRDLTELPDELKSLVHLQHLDLSYTNIVELPIAVKTLTNLKNLLIDGTEKLEFLPEKVISALKSLQVFSKMKSICSNEDLLLKELKSLENVICLGITLKTSKSIEDLLACPKLRMRISYLTIMTCSGVTLLNLSGMQFLEILEIRACNKLEKLVMIPGSSTSGMEDYRNLSHVVIRNCAIKNVNCLIYASSLQILELNDCPSVIRLIDENFERSGIQVTRNIFSKLRRLTLRYLPELQSICRHALPFPELTRIEVYKCPKLSIPHFSTDSKRSCLKEIRGEESWWNGLQWEDSVKQFFDKKFAKMDQQSFKL